MNRSFVLICATVALGGFGFALLKPWRATLPESAVNCNSVSFDPHRWRTRDTDELAFIARRCGMVRSLFNAGTLIGKTRSQIEVLLGPPDSQSWSHRFPFRGYRASVEGSDIAPLLLFYDDHGLCVGAAAAIGYVGHAPSSLDGTAFGKQYEKSQ